MRRREGDSRASRKGPQRVGEILGTLLEKKGLREPILRAGVVEEWEEKVGNAIAGVTRARCVTEDALIVEVRSSAWLMELDFMRKEILDRVNEGRVEGRVGKIVFVLAEQ